MHRILVIDDDVELYSLTAEYFAETGFLSDHAVDGETAWTMLQSAADRWDIVILDIMLPGIGGLDLLRRLRKNPESREIPVLLLSALGDETDRVSELEAGADDYMAKPFSLRELSARLRAILRRSGGKTQEADAPVIRFDELAIDRAALQIERDGSRLDLSPNEMKLLEILLETPGKTVPRAVLFERVFGFSGRACDRSLDMAVSRLRKKLGPRPDGGERIRAAWGEGYIFLP